MGQVTGLVMESFLYQEGNFIVSVFSAKEGMVRLFAPSRRRNRSSITPLTLVDCLYTKKGDASLFRLREWSLLHPMLELRESWKTLQLASTLVHTVQRTQLLWKPAPALYTLLMMYLRHAPKTANPNAFVASFLVKLLWHEGLLGLSTRCARCGAALEEVALIPGESLCRKEAPNWAIIFEYEELLQLCALSSIKTIGEIENFFVKDKTKKKINDLFDQLMDC